MNRHERRRFAKVSTKDLKRGPVQHTTLPQALVTRIQYLHSVFHRYDKMPLKTWLENFQRDLRPEREIVIWEAMARAHNAFAEKHPGLDDDAMFEVYSVLLRCSMGTEDGMRVGYLSTEEAAELQDLYYKARLEA